MRGMTEGASKPDFNSYSLYSLSIKKMDILNKPYYNFTRYMLLLTGQSRYLPKWLEFLIKSFFLFIIFSFIGAQIAGLIKVLDNIDLALECVPPACFVGIGAILFINNNLRVKELNVLFWKMQNDWNTLTSEHEVDILQKYGRKCKIYTIIYTFGFLGHLIVYLFLHLIPLLINIFKNSNEPKPLLFPLEFGIDSEKYYYLILLHGHLSGYLCTFAIVNGDTILLMFLEHACGIFEIIGYKLTTAIKENYNYNNNGRIRKDLQREIKLCVSMHRRVLLFVNDIQTVFSTAYLLVFGLCIINLSITGVQSVMFLNTPSLAIRFGSYTIGQVIHIFLLTLPTQHLLDNSLNLSNCIYNTDWYYLSTGPKRLLLIMMRKGSEPSTFIVGKIFILSLQFFTRVLQTSMSYFTVLMSVRR